MNPSVANLLQAVTGVQQTDITAIKTEAEDAVGQLKLAIKANLIMTGIMTGATLLILYYTWKRYKAGR